jgi:hypothetical protein
VEISGVNKSTVKRPSYRFGYHTDDHVGKFFREDKQKRRRKYAPGQFGGEQFRAFYGMVISKHDGDTK